MLGAGFYHMIELMHAGEVNGDVFEWWMGMMLVALMLLAISLLGRRKHERTQQGI